MNRTVAPIQADLREPSTVRYPLPREFYQPTAKTVASRLLGHWLVRNWLGEETCGVIVETEAYLSDDPACHGASGVTDRNRSMFGGPGHAYVYFIYGAHFCVNAVCRPAGVGEAVLIRAIEPVAGENLMRVRRPVALRRELTSGPAKLCQAMNIDRQLDGVDLCDSESPLWIAANPDRQRFVRNQGPCIAGRRIGISRAAHLLLRFYLARSGFVSTRIPG